jgi:hypothetical protein
VQTGNVKILGNVQTLNGMKRLMKKFTDWIGQTTGMLNKADERTGKKVKKLAYTCI